MGKTEPNLIQPISESGVVLLGTNSTSVRRLVRLRMSGERDVW